MNSIKKETRKFKELEDKSAERIAGFSGTLAFVYFHVFVFTFYILINIGAFDSNLIFDPYPFSFLTFVVSLEAIFLSTFVLLTQNRQNRIAERRAKQDYETNVKAELENHVIMTSLNSIAEKLDVDISDSMKELEKIREQHFKIKGD